MPCQGDLNPINLSQFVISSKNVAGPATVGKPLLPVFIITPELHSSMPVCQVQAPNKMDLSITFGRRKHNVKKRIKELPCWPSRPSMLAYGTNYLYGSECRGPLYYYYSQVSSYPYCFNSLMLLINKLNQTSKPSKSGN